MKLQRTVTLTPETIELVEYIANKYYVGNFSLTVELLLKAAAEEMNKRNG